MNSIYLYTEPTTGNSSATFIMNNEKNALNGMFRKTCLTCLLVSFAAVMSFGQTSIDLTGVVMTRANKGANGLTVKLAGARLYDTTQADGSFSFSALTTRADAGQANRARKREPGSAFFLTAGPGFFRKIPDFEDMVDLCGRSVIKGSSKGSSQLNRFGPGVYLGRPPQIGARQSAVSASMAAAMDTIVVMYRTLVLARKPITFLKGTVDTIRLTNPIPISHRFVVSDPLDNKICIINEAGAVDATFGAKQVIDVWQLANGNILYNDIAGVKEISGKPGIASLATVTASSEFNSDLAARKVVDGIIGATGSGEWASKGELNPWIRLDWNTPQRINKVILYDRPNSVDQVNIGTLAFSDGSSIDVANVPGDGSAKEIGFTERTVVWVNFQCKGGAGQNVGLSEIEINEKRLVWEYMTAPHTSCWSVQPLPDSSYVISVAGPPEILIVNRAGQLKKAIPLQNFFPASEHQQVRQVRRTLRGTFYAAFFYSNVVQEVDATGRILWSYVVANPHKVFPLPNGNKVISTGQSRILELNPKDSIVWELKPADLPQVFLAKLDSWWNNSARLKNGNTVFSNARGNPAMVEVSPQKEALWSQAAIAGISAQCEFHIMNEDSLDLLWPLK